MEISIPHLRGLNSYLDNFEAALKPLGWTFRYDHPTDPDRPADVTWIHWPEQLVDYQAPSGEDLSRILSWFEASSRAGVIAWTVHNSHRHEMPDHPGFNALYDMTARFACVQFHHGADSIETIRAKYARDFDTRRIPAGGYWDLHRNRDRDDARARIGLDPGGRPVLLVFGAIRSIREYRLVLRAAAFSGWHVLLVGRTPPLGRRDRVLLAADKALARGRLTEVIDIIPDDRVELYVNACDAVLVPRFNCLNSGVVFLGFTFGRPVIGPDVGNVGETLRLAANPVFQPSTGRLIQTLRRLRSVDLEEIGLRNAAWFGQHGDWADAAKVASETFHAMIAEKRTHELTR
ncbi:MAG: hypothetical protein JWN86_278 [Planctomycetota bacterium]|nr:hypothetical protein [Planctomycetota bacterium]